MFGVLQVVYVSDIPQYIPKVAYSVAKTSILVKHTMMLIAHFTPQCGVK